MTRKDTRRSRPGRDPLLIRSLRLAERVRELTESLSGDPCVIDRKPGVNVYRIYRVEMAGKLVQA